VKFFRLRLNNFTLDATEAERTAPDLAALLEPLGL